MRKSWLVEARAANIRGIKPVNLDPMTESARIPIMDLINRNVFIHNVGVVYIIRDGDQPIYVGATTAPLGARLRGAIANVDRWTQREFQGFSVSVVPMLPDSYDEYELRRIESDYIAKLQPECNIMISASKPLAVRMEEHQRRLLARRRKEGVPIDLKP